MDVYPTLVVCIQCLLFIISVYNYKCQTLLQLYFGYVIHYKSGLKYYYYFHVCSNKYYCLLKKKCLSHIGCVCLVSAAYNPSLQLQKLDPFIVVFCYVIYYKSSLKYYYYIKIYQECKKRVLCHDAPKISFTKPKLSTHKCGVEYFTVFIYSLFFILYLLVIYLFFYSFFVA